jgi:hypothetical protein
MSKAFLTGLGRGAAVSLVSFAFLAIVLPPPKRPVPAVSPEVSSAARAPAGVAPSVAPERAVAAPPVPIAPRRASRAAAADLARGESLAVALIPNDVPDLPLLAPGYAKAEGGNVVLASRRVAAQPPDTDMVSTGESLPAEQPRAPSAGPSSEALADAARSDRSAAVSFSPPRLGLRHEALPVERERERRATSDSLVGAADARGFRIDTALAPPPDGAEVPGRFTVPRIEDVIVTGANLPACPGQGIDTSDAAEVGTSPAFATGSAAGSRAAAGARPAAPTRSPAETVASGVARL